MKKNPRSIFITLFIFIAGTVFGFYIRTRTFDPRATFPTVSGQALNLLVQGGEKIEEDLLYGDTDLSDFILHGSKRTKVAVEGIVDKISVQPDGDYHVIIRDPRGLSLVTEFIPEIKLPLPQEGDHIKLWGIVRFDYFHNWWELHPVTGWQKLK